MNTKQGTFYCRVQLTRHHSGRAIHLALDWPLLSKGLLERLQRSYTRMHESLIHETFICHTNSPIAAYEDCLFLESQLGLKGMTVSVINGKLDRELLASEHQSTALALRIAAEVNWLTLWNTAKEWGPAGTTALQSLYKELTPSWESAQYPYCLKPDTPSSNTNQVYKPIMYFPVCAV